MAAERDTEGARRAVAEPFSDLGYPEVVTAQQILGDGHAPGDQVLHGRPTDGAREALEECRARQRSRPCELSHRPRSCELTVHLPDRWRKSRIGQPAQEP